MWEMDQFIDNTTVLALESLDEHSVGTSKLCALDSFLAILNRTLAKFDEMWNIADNKNSIKCDESRGHRDPKSKIRL